MINRQVSIVLAIGCLFTASLTSAFAQAAPQSQQPPLAKGTGPAAPSEVSSAPSKPPALTRELIDLIQSHKLVELRTIYNGPFAAALFFDQTNIEYYVALLKHDEFWWISRTSNSKTAEDLYSKMATQTIQLAAPSLEKLQLDARIAQAQRKLAEAQQKQAELAEQVSTQNRIVQQGTAEQVQLNAQAQQLAEQRQQLQRALTAVNSTIQTLQGEASKGPDISVAWPEASQPSPSTESKPTRRKSERPVPSVH